MPSVAEDGELASQAIAQTHRALPECPQPLPRDSSSRATTTYSRISRSASPMPAAQLSHRRFRPTCTHLTTTRLYTDSLLCDVCHQPPPWGWLYRCIQDRELELLNQIFEGEMLDEIFEYEPIEDYFDDIGEMLCQKVKLPPRGRHARIERYSLLREMTQEQLSSYDPIQLETLLKQRDNVHQTIKRQRWGYATIPSTDPGQPPTYKKQKGIDITLTCRLKACHDCRVSFEARSFLSLDGVADGDIPATAATGFGFHLSKSRPMSNPRLVQGLGLRPVPLTQPALASMPASPISSSTSIYSLMELLDELKSEPEGCDTDKTATDQSFAEEEDTNKASGHSQDLAGFVDPAQRLTRPPWTPPPSPRQSVGGLDTVARMREQVGPLGLPCPLSGMGGRSSRSLKTNNRLRKSVFRSMSPDLIALKGGGDTMHGGLWPWMPSSLNDSTQIPYVERAELDYFYDVGLTLPFDQQTFDLACSTPLPHATVEEAAFFDMPYKTTMEEYEDSEGIFLERPLQVPGGIALTEEAVESSSPDVMAQV